MKVTAVAPIKYDSQEMITAEHEEQEPDDLLVSRTLMRAQTHGNFVRLTFPKTGHSLIAQVQWDMDLGLVRPDGNLTKSKIGVRAVVVAGMAQVGDEVEVKSIDEELESMRS